MIGTISKNNEYFEMVIEKILEVCYNNMNTKERSSDIIVKKLCSLLDGREVFMSLASRLRQKSNVEFASRFIQSLDLILLTDQKLGEVRMSLRNLKYNKENSEKAINFFETLF